MDFTVNTFLLEIYTCLEAFLASVLCLSLCNTTSVLPLQITILTDTSYCFKVKVVEPLAECDSYTGKVSFYFCFSCGKPSLLEIYVNARIILGT